VKPGRFQAFSDKIPSIEIFSVVLTASTVLAKLFSAACSNSGAMNNRI
jgi:hypothetical protein